MARTETPTSSLLGTPHKSADQDLDPQQEYSQHEWHQMDNFSSRRDQSPLISSGVRKAEDRLHTRAISPVGHLRDKPCAWLPFTLRLPFLAVFLLITVALSFAALFMTAYSSLHHGLGGDDNSSGLFFGWRFSPTLVAVLYVLLGSTLASDVRRTEVYARLSARGGSSAAVTLCVPSRAWWNDPLDALRTRRNGGVRSWALFLVAIINILGLLVISPLSAALLSATNVDISKDMAFNVANTTANPGSALPVDAVDQIMFRTIAGVLLNTSTSAWVSNEYLVLPFWPSGASKVPLGASFADDFTPQQWEGQTVAYRTELNCVEMPFISMRNFSMKLPADVAPIHDYDYPPRNMTEIELASNDGCNIKINTTRTTGSLKFQFLFKGGGSWSLGPDYANTIRREDFNPASVTATAKCGTRNLIFVNRPWTFQQPFSSKSHLCETTYLYANVRSTVSISPSNTNVTFDTAEFKRNQKSMDVTRYNTSQIEKLFFGPDWTQKISYNSVADNSDGPDFAGPILGVLSSPKYNRSVQTMMDSLDDGSFFKQAQQFQQRYTGEMLLSSLSTTGIESPDSTQGKASVTERRIVVTAGIGIALGVLLLLSGICIAGVAYFTRLSRRPLNLYHEPGLTATASSLIASSAQVRSVFDGFDKLPGSVIRQRLQAMHFSLYRGKLAVLDPVVNPSLAKSTSASDNESIKSRRKDPRPTVLQTWMGPLLLAFLFGLIGGVLALFFISKGRGLHHAALVYQHTFGSSTILAPYSIVPTLLAVSVKLWFGAIEDVLKRVQAFSSMAHSPTGLTRSILVEYYNAPSILTSFKALKNSHWMLVLVGFVALATEIFTVSMSALWDREITSLPHTLNIQRQLEVRTVPSISLVDARFSPGGGPYSTKSLILDKLYSDFITGWLYTGTVEITQGSAVPPWTMEEWSFAPLDFSQTDLQANSSKINGRVSVAAGQSTNVTIQTMGLRGRLKCEPVDYIQSNSSTWLTKWDFHSTSVTQGSNPGNTTRWNSTNSPPGLDVGYEILSVFEQPYRDPAFRRFLPIGGAPGFVTCCANETNGIPGDAAIGYWSDNSTFSPLTRGINDTSIQTRKNRMVAKWIVGKPLEKLFNARNTLTGNSERPFWIWPEQPRILAVSCEPIIEQANASVTVEIGTGVVQNYTILDPPTPAVAAWSDYYLSHNVSSSHRANDTFMKQNITTSYGYLFWEALLYSGAMKHIDESNFGQFQDPEDVTDRAFNFRMRGLNADFMSYSTLQLANNSKLSLLDHETYVRHANKVFGTFFKHFVSQNVTFANGGQTFQPIGSTLPADFGGPRTGNVTEQQNYGKNGVNTPRTANATLHTPVEQLAMSPAAVWLSIAILVLLCLFTVVIYVFDRHRFKALPRDVDSLASVLGFVYGSERLLEWVRENADSETWNQVGVDKGYRWRKERGDEKELEVMMGPFHGENGERRWAVEITD